MEQPGGLSVAACRSATAPAAVRLFQTHRPHAVRLTVGPYHRRPVPGGVRGTTMELLIHSTRAQVPTRLDSRYEHTVTVTVTVLLMRGILFLLILLLLRLLPLLSIKKVKFSHTRYRALGPELIPVYRQSARR